MLTVNRPYILVTADTQGKTEPIKLFEVMARRAQRITNRPALKHEKGIAPPPREFDSLYRASLGIQQLEKAAIVHADAMNAFLSKEVRGILLFISGVQAAPLARTALVVTRVLPSLCAVTDVLSSKRP